MTEGTQAGVQVIDRGEEKTFDADNLPFYVKATTFEWHVGVTVKDWRYNVRIANIDVSEVMAGNVDLWALMRRGYYRLKSRRRDEAARK